MAEVASHARTLSPALLEEAARWYVQINDDGVREADRQAWQQWLAADTLHRQAWQEMQKLERRFADIPSGVVLPALAASQSRRRAIGTIALLLSIGALSLASYELLPWQNWQADYRTRTGERRRITLADGGTLDINTASSVDVRYNAATRLLQLHAGEILVQTARDPENRPFIVQTAQGVIRALGTRFTVRGDGEITSVAVFEHAVAITTAQGVTRQIDAGQQVQFRNDSITEPVVADPARTQWQEGRLIAIDQPLGDFIRELARYRPGYLGCAPEVANLRLSGAFRLHDTDAILANLTASLPVRITFVTRYWARVERL